MKYIKIFSLIMMIGVFASCMKERNPVFTNNVAEFDAAAFISPFGTQVYPLITRHPAYGRGVVTSIDTFITRNSKQVTFRVNMTGSQRSVASTVRYTTFAVGTAVGSSITYGSPISATLSVVDAANGAHYSQTDGICTIPANSSYGYITIPLINSNTSASTTALLGLELISGGDITPSENYKKVVFAISQK